VKIYERVRAYINDNGIKINFVAERSELNYKRLNGILNGRYRMSPEEFEAVCTKGLRVDPNIFFADPVQETKTSSA
jgi:transcriptional regulator with XRE-family HTH domain